jgi:hypothetical protein
VNVRQPILPALLGRFDGDLLPFGLFLRGTFGIKLYNSAVGNYRCNFGCTNLDGLLHDQLHIFAFWNCLSKNNPAAKRRCFRLMQFSQSNLVLGDIRNLCSEFAAFSVKEDKLVFGSHAQDVARVVGLGAAQRESQRVPVLRRDVKAMHGADGADPTYE